jgi:hypothetical protein
LRFPALSFPPGPNRVFPQFAWPSDAHGPHPAPTPAPRFLAPPVGDRSRALARPRPIPSLTSRPHGSGPSSPRPPLAQQPRNGIRPDFSPAFPSGARPPEIPGAPFKPNRDPPAPFHPPARRPKLATAPPPHRAEPLRRRGPARPGHLRHQESPPELLLGARILLKPSFPDYDLQRLPPQAPPNAAARIPPPALPHHNPATPLFPSDSGHGEHHSNPPCSFALDAVGHSTL